MLQQLRQDIVTELWNRYHVTTPQVKVIEQVLQRKNISPLGLDHFAIIDLPSSRSGISVLKEMFEIIGFVSQGQGYLPDKQNDFLWMAEHDSENLAAHEALPQVVVADFRLEEMPTSVRSIIEKYGEQTRSSPIDEIKSLITQIHPDTAAIKHIFLDYLQGRDWSLPTVEEFKTVQAFNELLAWVLVFGRRPNHFTVSVHLHSYFNNLEMFNSFIEDEALLELNMDGGKIKGGEHTGIAQGSTKGISETVMLADGEVELPTGFVEFVWRYQIDSSLVKPTRWNDYFTGFVADHANHVIESLYSS